MSNERLPLLIVGSNGIIGTSIYEYLKHKYDLIPTSRKKVESQKNFIQADLLKNRDIENIIKQLPSSFILIFLVKYTIANLDKA